MQRGDREIHESSPNAVMGDVRWADGDRHAGILSDDWIHRVGGAGLGRKAPACSEPVTSLRFAAHALRLLRGEGHLRGDLDAHALVVVEHFRGGHAAGFEHDFRHL